jgi:hypothetical protein
MTQPYWIAGSATASQRTNQFMVLIEAAEEAAALAGCIQALSPDWSTVEIDSIRIVDPSLTYKADDTLREAIETAQEKGFFLFLCDQAVSN